MKQFLTDILQKALNHYLALDPESKTRLLELEGKIVTLELLGLGLTVQLFFADHKIKISCDELLTPDTYIKGTPLTLLRMTLTEGDRKHFFAEDVSIEGNLDLGQKVIDLFDHIEIDWEEYLSKWVGDVSAHQIGRFAERAISFSKRLHETLLQNVNEYVHEEADLFPSQEASQDFFADVDVLRMDVDRAEARVASLKSAIDQYKARGKL